MPLAFASLLLASAILAPPADTPLPPADNRAIVVQGQRASDKQIRNFIRALTPAPPRGQLGRFESPVCPVTVGLGSGQNEAVAARLRRVAEAAGLAVAKAKCRPNVIVIVTRDKAALVRRMAGSRNDYFPTERNSLDYRALTDPATPVAAWQIEQTRQGNGRLLHSTMYSAEARKDGISAQRLYGSSSRISPPTRQEFSGAVVVVQADAIDGLTTTQLADYAAMRAFVRTDPAKLAEGSGRSILHVVTTPMGAPVPLTLTPWDLSFLKAYYASRLNNYAASQRSEMRERMSRDLGGEAESAE